MSSAPLLEWKIRQMADELEDAKRDEDMLRAARDEAIIRLWSLVGRGTATNLTYGKLAALFGHRDGMSQSNIRRLIEQHRKV